MNQKWHEWRWFAVASVLLGIVLALFLPTLTGSSDLRDFAWPGILPRFLLFAPGCFLAFNLLAMCFKPAQRIACWLCSWRVLKWVLRALACILALLVLFYLEENWRCWRAWNHYRSGQVAAGETFDFASFIPPPVPDDQNFALTPVVASGYNRTMDKSGHRIQPENTNVVDRMNMTLYRTDITSDAYTGSSNVLLGTWQKANLTDLKAWQEYYRAQFVTNRWNEEIPRPPPSRPSDLIARPGESNSAETVSHEEIKALTTNEFPFPSHPQSAAADVLFALSRYDAPIEELRAASRLPFSRFPLDYAAKDPNEIRVPHWESLNSCASVLRLRAIAELNNGQVDKALAEVRLLLYLANSIRHEPFAYALEKHLVLVDLAVQPVWEGLARRQWSADQLAALDRELGGIDESQAYGFAMRAARASNLKTLELLRMERMANSVKCMCGDIIWIPTLIYRLAPNGWFYLNERATAHAFESALPTADEVAQRILSPAISERFGRAEGWEWPPHLIPDSMWLNYVSSLPPRPRRAAQVQAGVDMARIACALERCRQAHGVYPEQLDALAPTFIEKIPCDIISGQPLHYRRTEADRFLLYSVGWNGRDDGGQPDPVRSPSQSFWQTKSTGDWVWQYPAN